MRWVYLWFLAGVLGLSGCASLSPVPVPAETVQERPFCKTASEAEIAALFDRWNASLQTGDPHKVVANYAPHSLLLPTASGKPRLSAAEKEDYFRHFLENRPSGTIGLRFIRVGCNMAFDAGTYVFRFAKTGKEIEARYTFTYEWDGRQWLITSHHSSARPEGH